MASAKRANSARTPDNIQIKAFDRDVSTFIDMMKDVKQSNAERQP